MSYIGKEPADSFISFAKQDFTTSATTSYTLDNAVANENELALFINFVRQEPTTAYTASGTTLTLTSATTSSDDMYCIYLGKAVQTVNPPSGSVGLSQLSATGTKSSSTFLRGDNTFASAGLSGWSENGSNNDLLPANASAGIYLGVNSATAANLLDDYEEGSWTPVCKSGGTTITIYGTHVASYTKVGRFVNVQFTIRRNDSASLTDSLQITGLPFTSSSSGMDANINGGIWVDNSSGDHMGFLNIGGNSTTINMRKSDTMDASIAADDWDNGRYLYGSANYISS